MPDYNYRAIELKEDLKVLDESVEHWIRMRDGLAHPGEIPDRASCPCCVLDESRRRWLEARECTRCPIYKTTLSYDCVGTPYGSAADVLRRRGTERIDPLEADERFMVQREIDFLTMLRESTFYRLRGLVNLSARIDSVSHNGKGKK